MGNNPKTLISDLWPDLDLTCDLLKFLMRIGIFSFRAFDRRLARLAAPISSGVRQGGRICSPPAGRVRLNTPAGRGLSCGQSAFRDDVVGSRLRSGRLRKLQTTIFIQRRLVEVGIFLSVLLDAVQKLQPHLIWRSQDRGIVGDQLWRGGRAQVRSLKKWYGWSGCYVLVELNMNGR